MVDHIKIRQAPGTYVIRADGAVIGESSRAMALRDASDRTSTCPWKGQASYYSIVTGARVLKDAVWSYEAPKDDMAQIAGHLAFYTDRVTVVRS